MATRERIAWIDIAKSIGLIFIIIGHNIIFKHDGAKYIYWFHVPLFFILSGFLHRQNILTSTFIQARFKHLMVPYLFFLSIVLLAKQFGYFKQTATINFLLGGTYLSGSVFMKWWFVPCLFATQIAAFFILKIKNNSAIIYIALVSYFSAIMIEWKYSFFLWGAEFNLIKLPLSMEIVPMALVFYLIGFLSKKMIAPEEYAPRKIVLCLLSIFLSVVLLDYYGVITIPFYMMAGQQYGFPLVNICIPLLCFILVRDLSLILSRVFFLKKVFTAIGHAAMPIMFLHGILPLLFIRVIDKMIKLNIDCILLRVVLGLFLPFVFYCFLNHFNLTRKFSLGLWH